MPPVGKVDGKTFNEWCFAVEEAAKEKDDIFDYKAVPFPWADTFMNERLVEEAAAALVIKAVTLVVERHPRLVQLKSDQERQK